MFLSDKTIKLLGPGMVYPFDLELVQPCSYDLRIDNDYTINPHEFLLASTLERVEIPLELGARVEGKSTWGRRGLFIHVTAGWIDPGFQGTITLELFNATYEQITISKHQRICQLAFFQLDEPAEKKYNGKYQHQHGPTPARPM